MYLIIGGAALLLLALWMAPSGRSCRARAPVATAAAAQDERTVIAAGAARASVTAAAKQPSVPSLTAGRVARIE